MFVFFNLCRPYCKFHWIPRRISLFTTRNLWSYDNLTCNKIEKIVHVYFLLTSPTSNLSVHCFGSILSFYDRQLMERIQHRKYPTLTLYSNYKIYMPHASNRLKSTYYTYFMFLAPKRSQNFFKTSPPPLSKILDPPLYAYTKQKPKYMSCMQIYERTMWKPLWMLSSVGFYVWL